jgi:hypothetical protein
MLGHATAVLLVGGLVIYGYLSVCYDRFYSRLGVEPNDVGLTYTGTLARSSGFVILYLFIIVYLFSAPVATLQAIRIRRLEDPNFVQGRFDKVQLLSTAVVGVALLVMTLSAAMLKAGDAAQDVWAGKPVGPIRFTLSPWSQKPLLPIPILAIHADPATLEPAGKPGDSPAVQRLRGRKLLYLGQSGGTVLLYDSTVQRAIYMPANSIVLQVVNCRAKPPPDAACQ